MKTEILRVRLTEHEKNLIQERATALNMSMSDYVKYCCLIEPPTKSKPRLPKTTRPLTDSKEDQELLADFLIREQDGEPPEQW